MASRAQFNSKSPTIRRIMKEAAELTSSPSPDFTATPLDDNLFEWHFTLRGPPGSTPSTNPSEASSSNTPSGVYSKGIYHGRIVLPPTYPLRPPSFRFFTPSGRFECNREICLSISGHHEETWQPAWGLRTALVALRTFMETDAKGQLGGLDSTDAVRRRLADESRSWKCTVCGKNNAEIIKECEEATKEAEERGEKIKEEAVPDELKLGYTDELRKSSSGSGKEKEKETEDEKSHNAQLAEGFVQTTPSVQQQQSASSQQSQNSSTQPYPAARPGQGVPQPTAPIRTIPLPPQAQNAQVQIQAHRRSNNGVPPWVDKLIALNVAFLAFLVFRWILAS